MPLDESKRKELFQKLKEYPNYGKDICNLTKAQRDDIGEIVEQLIYPVPIPESDYLQQARLNYWLAKKLAKDNDYERAYRCAKDALFYVQKAGLDLSLTKCMKVETKGLDTDAKFIANGAKLQEALKGCF